MSQTKRVRKRGQYDPNSPRAVRFCEEYLVDLKPGPAAVRAGYSARRAKETACTLLTLPDVQGRIRALMDTRSKALGLDASKTLTEIGRIAHADIIDLFDELGAVRTVREIPEDLRRAIASIEVEEIWEWDEHADQEEQREKGAKRPPKKKVLIGYLKKVRFWDKKGALELEGRHQKLFTDVVKHEGLDKLADAMRAAEERVANAR